MAYTLLDHKRTRAREDGCRMENGKRTDRGDVTVPPEPAIAVPSTHIPTVHEGFLDLARRVLLLSVPLNVLLGLLLLYFLREVGLALLSAGLIAATTLLATWLATRPKLIRFETRLELLLKRWWEKLSVR